MSVESTKENTTFSENNLSLIELEKGQKAIAVFGLALFEGDICPEEAHIEFGRFLTTEEQILTEIDDKDAKERCLDVWRKYGIVCHTQTIRTKYTGYRSMIEPVLEKGYKIMTCGKRLKVKFEEFYGPSIQDMLFTSCRLSPVFEHSKMYNDIVDIYEAAKTMPAFAYNYEVIELLKKISSKSDSFINEFPAVIKAYEIFTHEK